MGNVEIGSETGQICTRQIRLSYSSTPPTFPFVRHNSINAASMPECLQVRIISGKMDLQRGMHVINNHSYSASFAMYYGLKAKELLP